MKPLHEDALLAALKELAADTPAHDDPAMEATLRDKFRSSVTAERQAQRHVEGRRPTGVSSWLVPRWSALAAAAVFVLAAALIWYPAPQKPPAPSPTKPGKPSPRPRPSAAFDEVAVATVPAAPASVAPRPARPRSSPEESDQWASFVALPGMASLPDLESGRVLRVEVPVSALPTYGLDIVPDALPAAIEADLLVGQDGMPRAIRLASARPFFQE